MREQEVSTEARGERRCAVHGAAGAPHECPRCGNFACAACWDAERRLCRTCTDAGHGAFTVAFEQSLGGVGRTLLDVWTRPGAMFGALPAGRWTRAVLFCGLAYHLVALSLALSMSVSRDGTSAAGAFALACILFVAAPFAVVLFAAVRTLWSGGIARLFDSKRSASELARAYLYTGGYALALLPGIAAYAVEPRLGVLGLAAGELVGSSVRVRAIYAFLRGRGGLARWQALVAATLPPLLYWVPVVLVFVAMVYRRFSEVVGGAAL